MRVMAQGTKAAKPDFSGIWQANNTANWDLQTHGARPMVAQPGYLPNTVTLAAPVLGLGSIGWVPGGLGVVEGDEIPYQPWAAARKKENLEHWMDRDPEIKCFQPGVPRAMYMPYPFQIIQSDTKIMMVFEYANAQRTIHLNKMEEYPNAAFMGYSVGHWEGNTLVVATVGLNDKFWLDSAGTPHTEQLHLVERFTRVDADTILYKFTIDDPGTFTKPFEVTYTAKLGEPNSEIIEYFCIENNQWGERANVDPTAPSIPVAK